MSSDRRQTSRFKTSNEVRVPKELAPDGELSLEEFEKLSSTEVETIDLSEGGCQLFAEKPLPNGKELTFAVRLDDHVITVQGKVVRVKQGTYEKRKGWKIGVQFTDVEPMVQGGIGLYLVETGADPLDDPTQQG